SDQYSLAIVYQEMLTGQRPFPGTTALQLAAQHTSSPPLLDALPVQDRPVLARALAKVPEQRYPSCSDMVDALCRATLVGGPAPGHISPPPLRHVPPPLLHADTVVQPGPGAGPVPQRTETPWPVHQQDAGPPGDPEGLRPTLFIGLGGAGGLVLGPL